METHLETQSMRETNTDDVCGYMTKYHHVTKCKKI